MAKKAKKLFKKTRRTGKKAESGLAIAALLLNVLIIPGLGSIIAGRIEEGLLQIGILFGSLLIGFMLTITIIGAIIGIPIMIIGPLAAWIWGLVTGIQLIQESN